MAAFEQKVEGVLLWRRVPDATLANAFAAKKTRGSNKADAKQMIQIWATCSPFRTNGERLLSCCQIEPWAAMYASIAKAMCCGGFSIQGGVLKQALQLVAVPNIDTVHGVPPNVPRRRIPPATSCCFFTPGDVLRMSRR